METSACRPTLEQHLRADILLLGAGTFHLLLRNVVMEALCPEIEGGYRWSATSNYLNACRRVLNEGDELKARPPSRSKQLTLADLERIWELTLAAKRFWSEVCAEIDEPEATGLITREKLAETALGRRLFPLNDSPRGRLSALAA